MMKKTKLLHGCVCVCECVCESKIVVVERGMFRNADLLKELENISGGNRTGLQDPKILFQLHAWPDIIICLIHAQVSRFGSDECPSTPNLPIKSGLH